MSPRIETDDRGFPILLADSSTATAPADPAPEPQETWQSGQWDRRADAVRDLAREFETYTVQDIRELVRGRTNRELTDVEVNQFVVDVREQQLADLVDVLDQNTRGRMRGRRVLRLGAPKGYVRKTLNSLTGPEIRRLAGRLKARGWSQQQIDKLRGQFPEAKATAFDALDQEDTVIDFVDAPKTEDMLRFARETAAAIVQGMPQPKIDVHVPVTVHSSRPTRQVVQRDKDGALTGIENIYEDDDARQS